MTSADGDRLGDQPLAGVATVSLTRTVGEAVERAAGGWLVITDETGVPVATAGPGAFDGQPGGSPLAAAAHELARSVVAPASIRVRDLLDSWVVGELEPGSAVVVVAAGEVSGVWVGSDMRTAVVLGDERAFWSDSQLPGEIKIPLLTRACRYVEDTVSCPSIQLFAEPPAVPVACANPAALSAHDFGW